MTITNHSDNEKDIINAVGQYVIDCGNRYNVKKTFKWTFHIEQCHFVGIGIVALHDNANYIEPFYTNTDRDTISYICANDNRMFAKGIQKSAHYTQLSELTTRRTLTEPTKKELDNNHTNASSDTHKKKMEPDLDAHKASSNSKRTYPHHQGIGDLFVMTHTTVFRTLEEEGIWDIDQSIRDKFNAKMLYERALQEDIPCNQWAQWIQSIVSDYLSKDVLGNLVNNMFANGFGEGCMIDMEFTIKWCFEGHGEATLVFYDNRARTCRYGYFDEIEIDQDKQYCIAVCLASNENVKSQISLVAFSCEELSD